MNNQEFQKHIQQTEEDIFPLDRILPLATVYRIFKKHYEKIDDKSIFRRDRKYQRLREGLSVLFVGCFLKKHTGFEHFIVFPKDPSNDVNFLHFKNPDEYTAYKLECDVKEFTDYSDSFTSFITQKVIPKIHLYNIIIPIDTNIDGHDLELLIDVLQQTERSV